MTQPQARRFRAKGRDMNRTIMQKICSAFGLELNAEVSGVSVAIADATLIRATPSFVSYSCEDGYKYPGIVGTRIYISKGQKLIEVREEETVADCILRNYITPAEVKFVLVEDGHSAGEEPDEWKWTIHKWTPKSTDALQQYADEAEIAAKAAILVE